MASTVPLCEAIGIDVPAHLDEERSEYVLAYPFPCQYDEAEKRWLFDEGEIGWDRVFDRWKGRGPKNRDYVEAIQEGRAFRKMLEAA